ncbi:MAG: hypothetical protein Q8R00_00160 [Candidatus Nanoarchaeia archaeon]|nr:hypothetical protein [Candidatus Nanoarchaeia archaeon]
MIIFYLAGYVSPSLSQGMHLPMMKVDSRTAGLGNEIIWNFYPEVVTSDDAFEICNFLCEANNEEFCSRPLRLDTDANGEADREYTCGQLKMKCNKLSC